MVLSSPGVRATAAPFAVWVLLYVSGCADLEVPAEPIPVTPVPESMSTFGKVGYGYFKSNGKKVKLVSFTVDGTEHYSPTYLESGSHTILTRLQWSNHWMDDTELAVQVAAGHRYAIMSFELAPEQHPKNAQLQLMDARPEPPLWMYAAGGATYGALIGALPVIIMTAPLWGPAYLISQKYPPPPPTSRPFENCCFVWIQDVDSGAVVAGSSPVAPSK